MSLGCVVVVFVGLGVVFVVGCVVESWVYILWWFELLVFVFGFGFVCVLYLLDLYLILC